MQEINRRGAQIKKVESIKIIAVPDRSRAESDPIGVDHLKFIYYRPFRALYMCTLCPLFF